MIVCILDGTGQIHEIQRTHCEGLSEVLDALEDGEIYTLEIANVVVRSVIAYIETKSVNPEQLQVLFQRMKEQGMITSVKNVMTLLKCTQFEQDLQRFSSQQQNNDTTMDKLRTMFKSKLKV